MGRNAGLVLHPRRWWIPAERARQRKGGCLSMDLWTPTAPSSGGAVTPDCESGTRRGWRAPGRAGGTDVQ